MTAQPYLTPARLAELQARLGARDLAILHTLASIGVATGRQLERLHFHRLTPLSAARQRRATLARLHALGALTRMGRRIGGHDGGSAAYVWTLDIAGQRLTRPHPARPPRRPRTISTFTLSHRLAVTELYVRLVELTREQPIELACFHAEPRCWRPFLGPYGETVTLKPDAFLRLRTERYSDHYFIEIDQGTESAALLRRKLKIYRRYWASGAEQRDHGVFPLVLFLATDQPRAALIQTVIDRQPHELRGIYRTATLNQAAQVFRSGAAP